MPYNSDPDVLLNSKKFSWLILQQENDSTYQHTPVFLPHRNTKGATVPHVCTVSAVRKDLWELFFSAKIFFQLWWDFDIPSLGVPTSGLYISGSASRSPTLVQDVIYHCKKGWRFSGPHLECHQPDSPRLGTIGIFLARESSVIVTSQLGMRKSLTIIQFSNHSAILVDYAIINLHRYTIWEFGRASKMLYTANNFGLMYSRKRISQNSFPNFIHIIPKSFMVFCKGLRNPKRNYENQIWT